MITPYFATATPTTVSAMFWYAGGTLHNATIAEWRAADLRNKIATAADWATAGLGLTTLEQIQISTIELHACIETAFDTYAQLHNASDSIADLVIMCLLLLKSEAIATPTATSLSITPFPTLGQLLGCACSADLYNCQDFSGIADAQACFNFCVAQNAGDIHDLDRDNDNLACEDSYN